MSHHHQKQGGAGLGAGLDFFGPPRNRKFNKVVDRRGQPERGLWLRGSTYYARITVEDPDGGKRERRLALDASTLSEDKDALARLRAEPMEQNRRKKSVPLFPEFFIKME